MIMLELLLTSRARVALLSTILLDPNKESHARELSVRSGVPISAVLGEVGRLSRLGLVKVRKQGNLLLISANKRFFAFDEIYRLFLKTELVAGQLRSGLAPLNVRFAFIFGSVPKGTQTESSDIDLLVVGDEDRDTILEAVDKVEKPIDREIAVVHWSGRELAKRIKARDVFLMTIASGKLVEVVGEAREFRRTIGVRAG